MNRETLNRAGTVVLLSIAGAVSAWLVGSALQSVAGDKNEPWLIGRASGVSCYLLLVVLVAVGLGLSHPWRTRLRRPSSATRIRVHVSLAVFTLALLVLHVAVLATDSYAKVGWAGAFLPMGSQYRPVPITLGVIGAYAGLLAGLTGALAGRWARRVWWPIHKVSIVSLVLVWAHAVYAGSDATALAVMYAGTAVVILALAASRYIARPPGGLLRTPAGQTGSIPRASAGQTGSVPRTPHESTGTILGDQPVTSPVTAPVPVVAGGRTPRQRR